MECHKRLRETDLSKHRGFTFEDHTRPRILDPFKDHFQSLDRQQLGGPLAGNFYTRENRQRAVSYTHLLVLFLKYLNGEHD